MRGLIVRVLLASVGRRLGWMATAAVARLVVRRGSSRRVDQAMADLERRLPDRVGEALTTLPGDPLRLGGQALATGRSARKVAAGTGRVAKTVNVGRRRLGRSLGRAADMVGRGPQPMGQRLIDRIGSQIRSESNESRRRLRSEMLGHSRGPVAATDAMLDVRPRPDQGAEVPVLPVDLAGRSRDDASQGNRGGGSAAQPPPPVRRGRRRSSGRRSEPPVARVQRTYRPPRRPWER